MHKFLLFLPGFALLLSCNGNVNDGYKKTDSTPKPKIIRAKAGSLVIGNPLDCGIDGVQIFPVGANYTAEVIEPEKRTSSKRMAFIANGASSYWDSKANTEYINNDEELFDIRNILFYSLKDGNSFALFPDSMHILSFSLHKEYRVPLIYYRVVKQDINKDSLYTNADAVMLFISKLNGSDLVQVTPENEQFLEYFYYAGTHSILAKTVLDADKDHQFTSGDETNFRSVNLVAPAMGREIFSRSLRDSLRAK